MLRVEGLMKSFGSLRVVDRFDLEVYEGDALGVIGPNGAGKSTLFNLIAGAVSADGGSIRFNGQDITGWTPQARCRAGIGRTFQIPHPFEKLTVFENLLVAAGQGGGGKHDADVVSKCAAILERTGLIDLANTAGLSLTLLQRKRLELARALAASPRLLLLDEIAGGLTEAECGQLVELTRAIRAEGVTIVWIEHVVNALLAVADRLVVLDFGRKIAEGDPARVMQMPQVREVYMGIAA